MRTGFRLAAAAFALAALGSAAEVATTKERTFVVKYTDQSVERYSAKWVLDVTAKVREEGGSYVPFQGAAENRRCTWSVASGIERGVSLATRLGQTIALPGMARTLAAAEPLKGEHAGSCASPSPQREEAIGRAKKAALEAFDRITQSDLEELAKAARSKAEVASVTMQ